MKIDLSHYQRCYISKLPKAHPEAGKGEHCRICQIQVVFDRDLFILSKVNFTNVRGQIGLFLKNTTNKTS